MSISGIPLSVARAHVTVYTSWTGADHGPGSPPRARVRGAS